MVRSLLLTFALFLFASAVVVAQSTVLTGKVTDETGEPLIGASIKVLKGADRVKGGITDLDGNFRVSLDPGSYDLEVSYTGYATQRTPGVQVLTGQMNFYDVQLRNSTVLDEVVIKEYKVPLVKQDETSGGKTLTSEDIKNLPTRSVNAIVATTAGTSSIDGGDVNIKGSRSNGTNYYIDGVRVSGSAPPVQDIEQLQVVTGGLGAEYGDVTGGVISVVTKGPASEFHGYIEAENSRGLDPYGYLLTTANVSGPLIRRTTATGDKATVLGFRLSGQYTTRDEDNPPATPVYYAKDDVLKRIQEHPITLINGNFVPSAENLTNDSVDVRKARLNEGSQVLDLTGKLDLRVSSAIDLSLTGTYRDSRNRFDGGPNLNNPTWSLLNSEFNPTAYDQRYRGIFRFRHRLGNAEREQANTNRVAISNTSYQIQLGFERGTSQRSDPRHGDRIFDYGYVGRYGFDYQPVGGVKDDGTFDQVGYLEAFTGYQEGYVDPATGNVVSPNPLLANYNEFANEELYFSYIARNGNFQTVFDNIWSDMYGNTGMVYNRNAKSQSDIITVMASSSFDLKLGRTGVHSIQFGLINEQRIQRSYSIAPYGLWNIMSQIANQQFNGLNYDNPIGKYWDENISPLIGDSLNLYSELVIDLPENRFYKEVRKSLGLSVEEYVNINELRPDQLSLSMFAPRELTDQGLVSYYGYDYLGNPLDNGVTFNDFFTTRDPNDGVRLFPVAPLTPLYQGAYIKDKFTFNKMIFSLGLRVERFDLNTKVMRDPYSLYKVMTADEFHASIPGAGPRPANIGDDYQVYTTSPSENSVKAYRNGSTWYYNDGTQANDGNLIFGGGVVTPYLADTISGDDILDARFDPNTAFEDYTPQVNWLPRLAFSFPISEDANFFAHYDVLVQRPPSNWEVTPLSYMYFYTAGRTPENNANLLPERVVDYEVGFQQRLNQNSALKFSAYYRELRDMIQLRTILYVPVIGRYTTFGNIDFGTVKGFTVQYDLRRIQNAQLQLAYTLQFADGTGSNAESQRGLTSRGNIRSLYPLDFDERHNIQGIFDYRFDQGDRYNGPRIGGVDVLANFGANFQFLAVSGRPYTAKLQPLRFSGDGTVGAINGNRLPWRFNIDMRLDKSFNLSAAGKRPLNLNVYFRVANLLNRKNVTGVYGYTGSPTDDGYLATAQGLSTIQGVIDQGKSAQAYLDSYSWRLVNPGNYTLPRRLYVGASLEF